MDKQKILIADKDYSQLDQYFAQNQIKKILLVCGSSFQLLKIKNYFEKIHAGKKPEVIIFSEFQPNPTMESVEKGVRVYRESGCDAIVAVGGGSAMDVAKCIKLYANTDTEKNFPEQKIIPNAIPLLAVPTTAGSGSEATRYAVIYYHGNKQSVTHESCIPGAVLMDADALSTLPVYQKKVTMMDALCHCIESFWSVNSTDESKKYSKLGMQMVLENKDAYLANEKTGNVQMLQAAYLGGKAINITQTTAGHAMCYKLTGLYGVSHGHAVSLCIRKLWPYMLCHTKDCVDPRGEQYLQSVFADIAAAMGCETPVKAAQKFQAMFDDLGLPTPKAEKKDYPLLCSSVSKERLKNNPVKLEDEAIDTLYRQILA